MARVTVEDCIDKVENRFDLVLLASHRARAVSSGAQIHVARDNDKNPVVALREIADSKLSPDDLKEDLIHALQKHVEVDEPEAEAAPPMIHTPAPTEADAGARGAVRSHDRRGPAARSRRHGAAARAGRRDGIVARAIAREATKHSRRAVAKRRRLSTAFESGRAISLGRFRRFDIFTIENHSRDLRRRRSGAWRTALFVGGASRSRVRRPSRRRRRWGPT